MITISFLGLDPFTSEHLSKDMYLSLATTFGCQPDDIIVYAPESFLFHNGVDQTLWQALVHVHAPSSFRSKQQEVAQYLLTMLRKHIIHGAVEFYYYEMEDRYQALDEGYPRFVTEANVVNVESEEPSAQSVYQGDAFADIELEKSPRKKAK